jgi:hypothetical protein
VKKRNALIATFARYAVKAAAVSVEMVKEGRKGLIWGQALPMGSIWIGKERKKSRDTSVIKNSAGPSEINT